MHDLYGRLMVIKVVFVAVQETNKTVSSLFRLKTGANLVGLSRRPSENI